MRSSCLPVRAAAQIIVLRAQPPTPEGGMPSLGMTIDGAYRHTLLPYHGWMTQKAFEVAAAAAPDWDDVRPVFAPSDESFRADVAALVQHSQPLLKRIYEALTRYDFVDTRKSV